MTDDRRAVLEAIAYGDESTTSDRLRALELLRQLDEREAPRDFRADLAGLDGVTLDREYDAFLCEEVGELLDGGAAAERLPFTAKRMQDEIGVRAEARAAELADVRRIEAEIAERADERAHELYERRAFRVVAAESREEAASGPPHGVEAADTPKGVEGPTTPKVVALPRGLSADDLRRPWGRKRGSSLFPDVR